MNRFSLALRPCTPQTKFALALAPCGGGAVRVTAHLRYDRQRVQARQTAHLLYNTNEGSDVPTPIRITAHLRYDRARTARATAHLWYGPVQTARATAHLRYDAAPVARATAHLRYGGLTEARATAHLRYYLGEPPTARATAHLRYGGRTEARATAHLRYDGPAKNPAPVVTIAGTPVVPIRITLTEDSEQAVITAQLEFDAPLDAALWPPAAVELELFGRPYTLRGEQYSRSREFGSRRWNLTASSPAIQLQGRNATPVTGDFAGPASEIATQLAAPLPLSWEMINWSVQPLRFSGTGQVPLELLRTLVSAAGGALTSRADGTLVARPNPPLAPEHWGDQVAGDLDSLSSMLSISDQADERQLYDSVTVSDEGESSSGLRLEEDRERRVGDTTEVLAYQTPWQDNFDLRHCGDPRIVVLADLGVEERTVTDELVEVKKGEGKTQYPIYALLAARWNKINLGAITPSEDGTLQTGVARESLLYLSYRTRCRRYRVRGELGAEPLLLVLEDE